MLDENRKPNNGPFEASRTAEVCALCGADHTFLDEVITDDKGGRMFVCSDTDYCEQRRGGNAPAVPWQHEGEPGHV